MYDNFNKTIIVHCFINNINIIQFISLTAIYGYYVTWHIKIKCVKRFFNLAHPLRIKSCNPVFYNVTIIN